MADRSTKKPNKKPSHSSFSGKSNNSSSKQTKTQGTSAKGPSRPHGNAQQNSHNGKPMAGGVHTSQHGSQQKVNSGHGRSHVRLVQNASGPANPGTTSASRTTQVKPNAGNGSQNVPSGKRLHGSQRKDVNCSVVQQNPTTAKKVKVGLENPPGTKKVAQPSTDKIGGRGGTAGGRPGRGRGRGGANGTGSYHHPVNRSTSVGGTVGTKANVKEAVKLSPPNKTTNAVGGQRGQGGRGQGGRGQGRRGQGGRGRGRGAVNLSSMYRHSEQPSFSQIASSLAHGFASSVFSSLTHTVSNFLESKMRAPEAPVAGHGMLVTAQPVVPTGNAGNYLPVAANTEAQHKITPNQGEIYAIDYTGDAETFDTASQASTDLWEDLEEESEMYNNGGSVVFEQAMRLRGHRDMRGRATYRGCRNGLRLRRTHQPTKTRMLVLPCQQTETPSDDWDAVDSNVSDLASCKTESRDSESRDSEAESFCSSDDDKHLDTPSCGQSSSGITQPTRKSKKSKKPYKRSYNVMSKRKTEQVKNLIELQEALNRVKLDIQREIEPSLGDVNILSNAQTLLVRDEKKELEKSTLFDLAQQNAAINISTGTEFSNSEANPEPDYNVDENLVINYLVNQASETCSFYDIRNETGIFPCILSPETILRSLNKCRRIRVLVSQSDLDDSSVKVYFKKLRLCTEYRPPRSCTRSTCNYLHLCRDFLTNSCFCENCPFEHNVESPHNSKIFQECGVQIFTPEQKLMMIRNSNLLVCKEHNSSGLCSNPETCFGLHICNAFVMTKCLTPGDSCVEGHDLNSEHNRKILQLYEIDGFKERLISKMIVGFQTKSLDINDSQTMEAASGASKNKNARKRSRNIQRQRDTKSEKVETLSQGVVDASNGRSLDEYSSKQMQKLPPKYDLKERYKDRDSFELHACDHTDSCTARHGKTAPYQWRVKMMDKWIDFENNQLIEEEFCNPASEKFWGEIFGRTLVIDFSSMNCEIGSVQRLTTPSYSICKDRDDATRWQWYWWEPPGQWLTFGQGERPPFQDVMEAKYLHDPKHVCCFQIENCNYELDFGEMQLISVDANIRRRIRRRPTFNSSESQQPIQSMKNHSVVDGNLPPFWTPMDEHLTELVLLHPDDSVFRVVRHNFFSSLSEERFAVHRIYRIQNLDLWRKYQRKREEMERHIGSQVEINVYHGTPQEDTVRWICVSGFDQLMHGKHGSKLGKGLYFAKTSNYSNCYTRTSSRGLRYMFSVKIVIGRMTAGSIEYDRPPPIDPNYPYSGSYDTCVDNVINPNIYVAFDTSQCYPEFLIEYFEKPLKLSESLVSRATNFTTDPSHANAVATDASHANAFATHAAHATVSPGNISASSFDITSSSQSSWLPYPGYHSYSGPSVPQYHHGHDHVPVSPYMSMPPFMPRPEFQPSIPYASFSQSHSLPPSSEIHYLRHPPSKAETKDCSVM